MWEMKDDGIYDNEKIRQVYAFRPDGIYFIRYDELGNRIGEEKFDEIRWRFFMRDWRRGEMEMVDKRTKPNINK